MIVEEKKSFSQSTFRFAENFHCNISYFYCKLVSFYFKFQSCSLSLCVMTTRNLLDIAVLFVYVCFCRTVTKETWQHSMKTDIHFATGQCFCPYSLQKEKKEAEINSDIYYFPIINIKILITTSTCDTLPPIYIRNNTSTRAFTEWLFRSSCTTQNNILL